MVTSLSIRRKGVRVDKYKVLLRYVRSRFPGGNHVTEVMLVAMMLCELDAVTKGEIEVPIWRSKKGGRDEKDSTV